MEHGARHARAVHMATGLVREVAGCENWLCPRIMYEPFKQFLGVLFLAVTQQCNKEIACVQFDNVRCLISDQETNFLKTV